MSSCTLISKNIVEKKTLFALDPPFKYKVISIAYIRIFGASYRQYILQFNHWELLIARWIYFSLPPSMLFLSLYCLFTVLSMEDSLPLLLSQKQTKLSVSPLGLKFPQRQTGLPDFENLTSWPYSWCYLAAEGTLQPQEIPALVYGPGYSSRSESRIKWI